MTFPRKLPVFFVTILLAIGNADKSFADVRALKELPGPRDPAIVGGNAEILYSEEWWKLEFKKLKQAISEKNTELVLSIAYKAAGGWLYNAPGAYDMVGKGITYLRSDTNSRKSDVVSLIHAQAEVAQYVTSVNDTGRNFLATQVACAPYESYMIYKESGDDLLALQELENYYRDNRAERERLRSIPEAVPSICPLDDEAILAELIESHVVQATKPETSTEAAQKHFSEAQVYLQELLAHVPLEQVFRCTQEGLAKIFGGYLWSASTMRLYLARQAHLPVASYIALVEETLEKMGAPDPFSVNDRISGQKYLEISGAAEDDIWRFLVLYQALFLSWPDGPNTYAYQDATLDQLRFSIIHRNVARAEEVIKSLDELEFVDPDLRNRFVELQFSYQKMLTTPRPEIPMGKLLDDLVKASQTPKHAGKMNVELNGVTQRDTLISFTTNNPLSVSLFAITCICFVILIIMRIIASRRA